MVCFPLVHIFFSLYGQEVVYLMVEICGPRAPALSLQVSHGPTPHCRAYLCQVSLNLIFSIRGFSNAVGESQVHLVELIPHLVGRHHQEVLDIVSQFRRGGSLTLGAKNVVVGKFGPGLGH